MRKLIITFLFSGLIFMTGMYVGAQFASGETESLYSAYEEWQNEQAEEKTNQVHQEHVKTVQIDEQSIYSTTAKSFSDILKDLSRSVVFQVLSLFEKILGSS